jgi:signal peptidase
MDVVKSQTQELKKLWKNKRQLTFQLLNLAMIVFSALMIWKGLMVVTRSESPVVVVLRSVISVVCYICSNYFRFS